MRYRKTTTPSRWLVSLIHNVASTAHDTSWSNIRNPVQDIKAAGWSYGIRSSTPATATTINHRPPNHMRPNTLRYSDLVCPAWAKTCYLK